jgi:hypothetical protein
MLALRTRAQCALVLSGIVCLSAGAAGDAALARASVLSIIAADGVDAADVELTGLTMRRAGGQLRAVTTIAVLGGTYTLYASSESVNTPLTLDVFDKGARAFVGRFVLNGSHSKKATLAITSASILEVTTKAAAPTGRVSKDLAVMLALAGPTIRR